MTHNISKIQLYITCGFGDPTDLGFHILFFMQKLSGKIMVVLCKSCRIFPNETNKI
jgi:hypothetical protein